MFVSWLSFACFALAGLIHGGFFIYEVFVLPKHQESAVVKIWARNLGVYNFCFAVGTFVGLYFVLKLQVMLAGVLIGFCGISMIIAGLTLWFSAPRLQRFALLQSVPPALGFVFLTFHVLSKF